MNIKELLQNQTSMTAQQLKAVMFPGLVSGVDLSNITLPSMEGVTDTNVLGQRADTLWQGVAAKSIAKFTTLVAPLTAFATDMSDEQVNAPAGTNPTIYVRTIAGAGKAKRNLKNWNQTALANDYVPVTLTRISRPFGMTHNDLMHGETWETCIEAAIHSVVMDVFDLLQENVSAWVAENKVDVLRVSDLAQFTPEFVATRLSHLFGRNGKVENLILTPDAMARLIPHNAFMFNLSPGVYGIDQYHTSTGIEQAHTVDSDSKSIAWAASVNENGDVTHVTGDGKAFGIAAQRRAAVFAARQPAITGQSISVRSLGNLAGIPLLLKTWEEPGTEYLMNSVETMAGFALTFGDVLRVLTTAAEPAAVA